MRSKDISVPCLNLGPGGREGPCGPSPAPLPRVAVNTPEHGWKPGPAWQIARQVTRGNTHLPISLVLNLGGQWNPWVPGCVSEILVKVGPGCGLDAEIYEDSKEPPR